MVVVPSCCQLAVFVVVVWSRNCPHDQPCGCGMLFVPSGVATKVHVPLVPEVKAPLRAEAFVAEIEQPVAVSGVLIVSYAATPGMLNF